MKGEGLKTKKERKKKKGLVGAVRINKGQARWNGPSSFMSSGGGGRSRSLMYKDDRVVNGGPWN